MKRKRGNKKGKKSKKRSVLDATATSAVVDEGKIIECSGNDVVSPNTEDNSSDNNDDEIDNNNNNNNGDFDNDNGNNVEINDKNGEEEEKADVAVVKPEMPPLLPRPVERPPPVVVYGRVKVKLKTAAKPILQPEPEPVPQAEPKPPVVEGGEKEVSVVEKKGEESGNSGSTESNKSGGGTKSVSLKESSPSSGNEKESGGSGKESGGGGGIKIVSLKRSSLSPSSGNDKESGGGGGIKIVSLKSSSLSLSPSSGNDKESNGNGKANGGIGNENGGIGKENGESGKENGESGKENGGSGVSPDEEEGEDEEEVEGEEEEEEKEKVEKKPKVLNKQELDASLEVIKKVMKMDAAEPFNKPVNPIELGIPDYFDVIDTPMDFGTVRNNLESGAKYMDSEDVYKDVEYIWDNCFKYNNKGDYVVDLMKRVKKNFMKHWVTAGLYTEETKNISGGESTAVDEPGTSNHGKKFKRGKGFKLHKDDCMCAICIMRRRRREREAREAQAAREAGVLVGSPQIKVSHARMPGIFKQEENTHAESPGGYTSSYMETSPDRDVDVEMEDGEIRLEGNASQYDDEQDAMDNWVGFHDISDRSGNISEKPLRSGKGDTETHSHVEARLQDESDTRIMIDAQNQLSNQPEGQSYEYLQQRNELLELEKKRQRLRLLETFRDLENPMLSSLCASLFPNNVQNVWNGPNSLVQRQRPCRRSDIHEAVASLMDPSCKSVTSPK